MHPDVGDGHSNSRFCYPFSHSSHSKRGLGELVNSFENSLTGRLDELKPDNLDFLNLPWIRQAIEVLSKTFEDLKILIADLIEIRGGGGVRERWVTEFLDDTIKLLEFCNGLRADISMLNDSQLILIQSVRSFLDMSCDVPQQDNLYKAKISIQEWIEGTNQGFKKKNTDNHLRILQGLSTDLELQMGRRTWGSSRMAKSEGKSIFLRAMSGVKAMIIFICSVISCVLSSLTGDQQRLQGSLLVELQVPSQLLWSASFMSLQKVVNEEMTNIRNKFLLNEWKSLDSASQRLYGILDQSCRDLKLSPPDQRNSTFAEWEAAEEEEQQHKKQMVEQGVEELGRSSVAVTQGVRLLTHELNDLFNVVLNVSTVLLDSARASPQPLNKIFHNYLSDFKMKMKIGKQKIKLKVVLLRIRKKWRACRRINATFCLRTPETS